MPNYHHWGSVVNEYYVSRFRAVAAERRRRLEQLQDGASAGDYARRIRELVGRCVHSRDWDPAPLECRCISSQEAAGLRMEALLFRSPEGDPIPAAYYRPVEKAVSGKIPAVLLLCGHEAAGKDDPLCRGFAMALAARGMAVLVPDPVGQGERLLPGEPDRLQNAKAHDMIGKKLIALGDWFGSWQLRDAVRCCSWLAANPEIDASGIYCAGWAGGGFTAAMLPAVESRLAGAVVINALTSWCRNVENELASPAEMIPPGLAGQGCDMADLLIAGAPARLLVLASRDSARDIRGTAEACTEIRTVYGLLQKEDRVKMMTGQAEGAFPPDLQKAALDQLAEWTGLSVPAGEAPDLPGDQLPAGDALRAAPDLPSVYGLPGMLGPDDLLRRRLEQAKASRRPLSPDELRERFRQALGVNLTDRVPEYRVLRNGVEFADAGKYQIYSRYLLELDGEIQGVLHFHQPECRYQPEVRSDAILYLPHESSPEEMYNWQVEDKVSLCSFDYWGVGELRAASCDMGGRDFQAVQGADYHFSCCGLMLGECLAGRRIMGIVAALQLLKARGARKITLAGAGISALPALWTAFLYPEFAGEVILINPTSAYEKLFAREDPLMPQSSIIPGILQWGDLSQMYQEVRPNLMTSEDFPNLLSSCR